ncbi:hypothetical protein MMC27_008810 [Xylographa pallens]|nr:hypothetical protein [Xylographa pallens]
MSSTFKALFGKKSNEASDMAPPSYATRPPKNHKKALSNIDSEEDDEVMPPSHVDPGRSKQVYDIDSDEEEAPPQSERPRTRARSHGGKGKVDQNRSDAHGKQRSHHDSGRRGTSQALVRREPSLSDEEPGPSRGHLGANNSKALKTRGHGGRDTVNEDDTITIKRFRTLGWKELTPLQARGTAGAFEISTRNLKTLCDDGKVRFDCKNQHFNFDLMYPLFPPHIVNRVKYVLDRIDRKAKEKEEHIHEGRTIVEKRILVPIYMSPDPYLEPYHEPSYEDEYEPCMSNAGCLSAEWQIHDPSTRYCQCAGCKLTYLEF